jgi:CBS-domain-containing membrane protein
VDTPVRVVMSHGIEFCSDTDTLMGVADRMAELQIRRMPVLNQQKRLVGIVSLGDISKGEQSHGGRALKGISKTAVGGAHHAAN